MRHGVRLENHPNFQNILPEQNVARRRTLLVANGFGVNNSRGLNIHNTIGNGCDYWIHTVDGVALNPTDVSKINSSSLGFTEWKTVKKDKKTIFKISAKGVGAANFDMTYEIDGNAYTDITYDMTWAENLTPQQFLDKLTNRIPIKINNPSGATFGDFWGVTRVTPTRDG